MENPEEILHSLEEFSKLKPKDIPRELEDYLCFVAKTGDPVYQWSAVKSLFREKLINVITEFYESCPSVEIPPCPNVEMFNYDSMKNFILEKLDTFAAAPFTVQRICELLTTPRKEYNRIDKYMRALEKNILVVSTTEPGNRRSTENGEGIVNGIETEHLTEANSSNDINVEEMDDSPSWPRINQPEPSAFASTDNNTALETQSISSQNAQELVTSNEHRLPPSEPSTSTADSVITCTITEKPYASVEPIVDTTSEFSQDVSITVTAIPAAVQKRRDSIEPLTTDDNAVSESVSISKAEESVKDTTEDKPEILTNEVAEKTVYLTVDSFSAETSDVKDDTNTDDKIIENSESQAEYTEVPKDEKSEDIKADSVTIEEQIEEPKVVTVPVSESEPETTCDNVQSVKNVEDNVESPSQHLSESPTEEVHPEQASNLEVTADVPTIEENIPTTQTEDTASTRLIEDTAEKVVEDQINSISPTEPIIPTEPEQPVETPMEVDMEENLLKEPAVESSNVDTIP